MQGKLFLYLLCKQIVEQNFAVYGSAIHILFYSVGADKCMVQGFACLGGGTENLSTSSQVLIILLGDFVLSLGEFHFTKVYCLVPAVNQ